MDISVSLHYTLDEWDYRFIYRAKRGGDTSIEDLRQVWADRCGLKLEDVKSRYLVVHFMPIMLALHHNPVNALCDVLDRTDPNHVWKRMARDRGDDTPDSYWDSMLINIASQLAWLDAYYIPNYVAECKKIGLTFEWLEKAA